MTHAIAAVELQWPSRRQLFRASVLSFFLVIPLVCAFLAMPFLRFAPRSGCRDNLQAMGLAFHNYHSAHGQFPDAVWIDPSTGNAASWRIALGPYFQGLPKSSAYRFDQAWNSQQNLQLLSERPAIYVCPTSPPPSNVATDYVMVVGGALSHFTGQALPNPSATLLVVEGRPACIPWLEPRDLTAEALTSSKSGLPPAFGGVHPRGGNVLMADGHVEFLDASIDPKVLRALVYGPAGSSDR